MIGKSKTYRNIAGLLLSATVLAACNQGVGDLQQFVVETKNRPPGRI
ncbi:MAG: Tfp pilus assembly protein PilP, partial [Gammaproteobacteria bacterium]